jgi:hypothetical protein
MRLRMAAIISPRFTPAPPSRLDLSRGGKGEWPRRPFVDRPAPFCYDAPIDARPRALRGRRKTHNSEAKEPAVRMRALVLATLLIAALVAADHLRAQAPSSGSAAPAGASAPVPRTPWGHPDLQGTWDYRTITPLERPAQYGDRQYLTDEEVKALEERAAKRMDEPPSDEAPNQAGPIHATAAARRGPRPGRLLARSDAARTLHHLGASHCQPSRAVQQQHPDRAEPRPCRHRP